MATFDELIDSSKPVLVDFFATWCGPCQTLIPVLDDVKSELGTEVTILKIDVDKNRALADKFQVRGVPTLMLYKNGKQLWRGSGVYPKYELLRLIKEHS